jgi:hypothetical protein
MQSWKPVLFAIKSRFVKREQYTTKKPASMKRAFVCGTDETRTRDLLRDRQAL